MGSRGGEDSRGHGGTKTETETETGGVWDKQGRRSDH